jgi:hypothetical protein
MIGSIAPPSTARPGWQPLLRQARSSVLGTFRRSPALTVGDPLLTPARRWPLLVHQQGAIRVTSCLGRGRARQEALVAAGSCPAPDLAAIVVSLDDRMGGHDDGGVAWQARGCRESSGPHRRSPCRRPRRRARCPRWPAAAYPRSTGGRLPGGSLTPGGQTSPVAHALSGGSSGGSLQPPGL